ncbi:hypothetical protein [Spirosoma aerolatum]|uniref:hypothetical protein n=1 Tax=Spirosoma aerolatum TaxID=1211326 RepID=UPI0009ACB84B|nr:hypothetical protein [Spirosoma aerolatum]
MRYLPILLCFCLPLIGIAQKRIEKAPFRSRNTIYLEGLGAGGFYSLNYERLLLITEKQAYGFRVGTSYFGNIPGNLVLIGELFTLVGKGNHHGDFGIGLTGVTKNTIEPSLVGSRNYFLLAIPRLSYRYQKPTGGLMVRAGFTPLIDLSSIRVPIITTAGFQPWLGLSIGHSF